MAMQPGHGSRGFFLTPQGKVRSYFNLWNPEPDSYAFEFENGTAGKWKNTLLSLIDQYHFGEKITVADAVGIECRWIFGFGSESGHQIATQTGVTICEHGALEFGRPWTSIWGEASAIESWLARECPGAGAAASSSEEVEFWRIEALQPRMDSEVTENTIPLEIGLRDGVAENKGCYPGQEVIEKILSYGAPSRRLSRIEGTGPAPNPVDRILSKADPSVEIGAVTSVAGQTGHFVALGFIKKLHAKEGTEILAGSASGKIAKLAPYS